MNFTGLADTTLGNYFNSSDMMWKATLVKYKGILPFQITKKCEINFFFSKS